MGDSSPSSDTLPVGRGTGGATAPGGPGRGRRHDRGDRIGRERNPRVLELKGLRIWGFLHYPGDRLCLVQRISAFSLCSPETKQVNAPCLEGEIGKPERDRILQGGPWVWILPHPTPHTFAELFFVRVSFRDPQKPLFPNAFCVWFQWGFERVLERPVIMKEQEEGGNSLEAVISGSSWSMPIRHDFIDFEVVASVFVQGGEDW